MVGPLWRVLFLMKNFTTLMNFMVYYLESQYHDGYLSNDISLSFTRSDTRKNWFTPGLIKIRW